MLQKIHWLYPWKIRHEIRMSNYWRVTSHYIFAELTSEGKSFDILIPKEKYHFITDGKFYGMGEESVLEEMEVVPNEKLKFVLCSSIEQNKKKEIEFLRVSSTDFQLNLKSIEIKSRFYDEVYYSSKQEITEILNEEQLQEKLQSLEQTIEVYPFILPFGNCFSITNL